MPRSIHALLLIACGAIVLFPSAIVSHAQIPIAEAREQGTGASVTVEGTVTRAYGDFVRLQDGSGPTDASALVVRQTSGDFHDDVQNGTITKGTQLQVSGVLSEFNGLLQINEEDLSGYTVQAQGSVPAPQEVTLATLAENGEDYESELVRVTGLTFRDASGTFENRTSYTVEGETGTLTFRVQSSDETALGGVPIPARSVDFTGVLGEYQDEYQLTPVRTGDLGVALFQFGRSFALAQEGSGEVSVDVTALNLDADDQISVTAEVADASTAENGTDVTGFSSPQTLSFSGPSSSPQTLTFTPAEDSDDREGVERLEVTLSSQEGVAGGTFTLWVLDDATAQGRIASGLSGGPLIDQLQQTYGDPTTLGYDVARDTLFSAVYEARGDSLRGLYTRFARFLPSDADPTAAACNFDSENCTDPDDINTEHAWPQSRGAGDEPARSNMHILFPARADVNSARSNLPYGEIVDADTDRWFTRDRTQSGPPAEALRPNWSEVLNNERFEPRHDVKGDVARALLYFVTVYPNRADRSFFEDQRAVLLDWHSSDPVDATEMRRNLRQASYQDNKMNPFVVDPTLAERAYADGIPAPEVISIQDARQQGSGTVRVEGVVTRVGDDGPYIQDDTGGLYVFESEGTFGDALQNTIERGTRLQVTGSLEFYNGLLELTDVPDDGFEVLAQDESLPAPPPLTLREISQSGEDYEAELVRVEELTIDADGDDTFQGGTNYGVEDGTGSLTLRVPSGSALEGEPIPSQAAFRGPLGQFNGAGAGADDPDSGYQLLAVDESDLEAVDGGLPSETAFDVTRSFGDPSTGKSYRLVALPGQVDRSLASTLSGDNGLDWEAYWDDGTDQDFFLKYDGSDTFDFRPGRGFWLLSTEDWSVEGTVNTVPVTNGTTTIPLREGWNIISNPLPKAVSWSAVQNANGGQLQALWRWENGQFRQASTFAAATTGEAFYFQNNQGLDALTIPVSTTGESTSPATKSTELKRAVDLVAQQRGKPGPRVQVAEHASASDGQDRRDLIAPPSQFAPLSLRLEAPFGEEASGREQQLARDVRSAGTSGQTYTLVLRADTTGPVTIRATSLPRSAQTEAVLLDPDTGTPHDLRTDGPMTVTADPEPTRLRLLVGTASYVDAAVTDRLPDRLTVRAPTPNPFRDHTTIRYALPTAQKVQITVYDLLGRQVHTLIDRRQEAGKHQATWHGLDEADRQLASGTYLVRLSAGGEHRVEKVVLVR